ncbi:hypothetical protein GW796_09200 [archaeon]|nr:hypothetical protein [archaeon]NCT58905.1 hypothetical protein [archaeon]
MSIIEALREIYLGNLPRPVYGICGNINKLAEGYSDLVNHDWWRKALISWDKFTGDFNYPIPATNKKYNPSEQYNKTKQLWSGKQGELRKELVNHLIKFTEGLDKNE